MPYISPEVVAEAKQMDLLTYLRNYEPEQLVHVTGDTYCTKDHDSLKISNGKWCWWSRNIGGKSALDYLIKVQGYAFTDAVERIMGNTAIRPPVPVAQPQRKRVALQIPTADASNDRVIAYLKSRCIDEGIIHACIESGLIYQTSAHKNVAFVGFDSVGTPRMIDLRSTGDVVFKNAVLGSDRHFPFQLRAVRASPTVHLFEGSIDALSYATLLKLRGRDWKQFNLLSMGGIYRPKEDISQSKLPIALTQYLADNPQTQRVCLHLDNDEPGRLAAQAIQTVLPKELTCVDQPAPSGKDINDYLCNLVRQHQQQARSTSSGKTR